MDSQGVITRRNTLRLGMECSAMFAPNVTTPHEQLSRGSDSAPPTPEPAQAAEQQVQGQHSILGRSHEVCFHGQPAKCTFHTW